MRPLSTVCNPLLLLFLLPAFSSAQPSSAPYPPIRQADVPSTPPTSSSDVTRYHIPRSLEPRQQQCTDPSSALCSNLPTSKFCCPSGTECIPLDEGASVICCKLGGQCDQIKPVTCPIAGAGLLGGGLEEASSLGNLKCGELCCPIGFQCSADKKTCVMKPSNVPAHYKTKPSPESPSSSSSPSSPEAVIPVPSPPSSSFSSSESATSPSCAVGPEFPTKAVLVGFFPGLVLGALLLFLASKVRHYIAMHRSRRRRSIKSFCQDGPLPPPIQISGPIMGTSREDAAKVLAWSSSSPMTPFGPFSARLRGNLAGSVSSNNTSLGGFINAGGGDRDEKRPYGNSNSGLHAPSSGASSAPWSPDGTPRLAAIPARLRTVTSSTASSAAQQPHPSASVAPQTATVSNLVGVSHGGWDVRRELVPGNGQGGLGGPGGRGTVTTLGSLATNSEASWSPPVGAPGFNDGIRPLSSAPPPPPLKVGRLFEGKNHGGIGSIRSPGGYV